MTSYLLTGPSPAPRVVSVSHSPLFLNSISNPSQSVSVGLSPPQSLSLPCPCPVPLCPALSRPVPALLLCLARHRPAPAPTASQGSPVFTRHQGITFTGQTEPGGNRQTRADATAAPGLTGYGGGGAVRGVSTKGNDASTKF